MIRAALEKRFQALRAPADLELDPGDQRLVARLLSRPFAALHFISEAYTARAVLLLALDLGWEDPLRRGATMEELTDGLHAQSSPPAAWMLGFLAQAGMLVRRQDRWWLERLPDLEAEQALLRAMAETEAPGHGRNLDLLDAVRRKVPPFFREGRPGEELLFDLASFSLWLDYFRNENLLYRANNLFAYLGLQGGLRPGCRILELGGGAGSFARFLALQAQEDGLEGAVAEYRFTDVAPPFLHRAQRGLREQAPGLPLTFAALDMNRPLDEQGFQGQRFDAIVGVNALHVARDLQATLRDLRSHLAPEGRLVLGECLKSDLARPIYLEFPFQFLSGFRNVKLDPDLRPAGGFLTPELWTKSLRTAGFARVEEIPKVRALMEHWEFFNVGAFVAHP